MKKEYKDFVEQCGGLNFDTVSYRHGALTTCEFGLVERYKVIEDRTVWGYPGIHSGIDRGRFNSKGGEIRKITVPFDFTRGGLIENDKLYGTQVLFYHKFGFRMFIAHMYPDEILIKDRLSSGLPLYKDTPLGDAGSAGFSTGRHTHTEIEAWGENWTEGCEFLEQVLLEKYGDAVNYSFTDDKIYERYMEIANDKSETGVGSIISKWTKRQIMEDYTSMLKQKAVVFINDYKIKKLSSNGRVSTFYSSNKLFGF